MRKRLRKKKRLGEFAEFGVLVTMTPTLPLGSPEHRLNNVVVTDLREVERLPAGNRFLVYRLFPETNVSLRVHWGPAHNSVIAAVGHSIFNRTCKTSVGDLMSKYGGGGHRGAGTCVLPLDKAAEAIDEILFELQANG